jgi:hypothetical protein
MLFTILKQVQDDGLVIQDDGLVIQDDGLVIVYYIAVVKWCKIGL